MLKASKGNTRGNEELESVYLVDQELMDHGSKEAQSAFEGA